MLKTILFNPESGANPQLYNLIWIIAGAVGIWLGFPNDFFALPPLVLLWPLALTFLGIYSPSCKNALVNGWCSAFLGSCAALYWLALPVHYVGQLSWPLALICAFLISACLSTQSGCYAMLVFYLKNRPIWLLAIISALSWYVFEYIWAVALGFPWLQISGALSLWPVLIQGAEICGANLWTAFWIIAVLWLGLSLHKVSVKKTILLSAFILSVLLIIYGSIRLWQNPVALEHPDMDAIFIEGNIDQNQKWVPEFQQETLNIYMELTYRALNHVKDKNLQIPLIIWPETAMPFFYERNKYLARQIAEFVKNIKCPLLFGAPGVAKSGIIEDAVYNRAFLLSAQGEVVGYYDKEHLVPFGEYLPEWLNFSFLQSLLQGVGIYQSGTHIEPLTYQNLALGMLICYEGIFPWLAQQRIKAGANILVDISNDGWFGRTPAARQHLYLTVARALEQNRWLLRATNTGISAVIDARGRVLEEGPQFKAGWLLARAVLKNQLTLYNRYGNYLPFIVCFLVLVLIIISKPRKTGEN